MPHQIGDQVAEFGAPGRAGAEAVDARSSMVGAGGIVAETGPGVGCACATTVNAAAGGGRDVFFG